MIIKDTTVLFEVIFVKERVITNRNRNLMDEANGANHVSNKR